MPSHHRRGGGRRRPRRTGPTSPSCRPTRRKSPGSFAIPRLRCPWPRRPRLAKIIQFSREELLGELFETTASNHPCSIANAPKAMTGVLRGRQPFELRHIVSKRVHAPYRSQRVVEGGGGAARKIPGGRLRSKAPPVSPPVPRKGGERLVLHG